MHVLQLYLTLSACYKPQECTADIVCAHPMGGCRSLQHRIDFVFVAETNKIRRNICNKFTILIRRHYLFTHQNCDLVEKYLKPITSFISFHLQNSKPTPSRHICMGPHSSLRWRATWPVLPTGQKCCRGNISDLEG